MKTISISAEVVGRATWPPRAKDRISPVAGSRTRAMGKEAASQVISTAGATPRTEFGLRGCCRLWADPGLHGGLGHSATRDDQPGELRAIQAVHGDREGEVALHAFGVRDLQVGRRLPRRVAARPDQPLPL